MPARRIIRPATHFQLTRVTRIFQKSAFTKVAPTSPGDTPLPGFFVARPPPPSHSSQAQPSSVGIAHPRLFHVLAAAALAPGASCFLPPRRDELVATTKRPSPASEESAMIKIWG